MFNKLVNTRYFSEAGLDFYKNEGAYTKAPIGSREYKEYWDLQDERCLNGYSVGDLWIPGRHYFYLNFCPISRVPESTLMKIMEESRGKRNGISKATLSKIMEFPRFWEIDYQWYNYKYIAANGGSFNGVTSPGGQHICCGKARGAGFSYKEASDGVYNYNFIPGSKSYYFASIAQYLDTDGILNKAQYMMDFINTNCHEWKQNRQKKNTVLHQRASYIDEFGNEKGSMSEIIGIVVDDPEKVRGKRGAKITFEEAGSFKNLKKAISTSVASIKDGGFTVGQMTVFGTGGEEGPSIEGLEDVFYNPEVFNMLAFPSPEEGYEHTECGFFVPCTMANPMFMDIEGNIDLTAAREYEMGQRAVKAKSKDPKELDRRKAEYPLSPSELFQRLTVNMFNIGEVDAQIRRVESSSAIQSFIRYGSLVSSETENSGYQFVPMTQEKAKPVIQYPHKKGDDLSGCITIYEKPFINQSGQVPIGLYSIVFDPYYKEEAEDLTSLFVAYVIKQYNNISPLSEGLPVASYIGRPQQQDVAFRNLFALTAYYNSTVQGEIAGGGQGVLDYAKRTRQLEKVEFEPEMLHNKEIMSNQRNRSYLMNMIGERKRLGLTYLADWHMQPRGLDEKGNIITNTQRIYDLGLLREMRRFDGKKNADRISAMIIAMFVLKEKAARVIVDRQATDSFYNRELYGSNTVSGDMTTAF